MKVGAVVLAAGGSSRFGQPKQLLVCAGETLVRRAARAALTARGPVVVVVGRDGKEMAEELVGLPVTVVPNDNWERGIGSSLRCGMEAKSVFQPKASGALGLETEGFDGTGYGFVLKPI